MNIQELSGPWSFVKQAWKIFWKHKGWYFAFAALPMILSMLPSYYTLYDNMAHPNQDPAQMMGQMLTRLLSPAQLLSYLCTFLLAPLFTIAWNQYLLNPAYKTGLQSYLTFDAKYFKYVAYHIFIMLLIMLSIGILAIIIMPMAKNMMVFMIGQGIPFMLALIFSVLIAAIIILSAFYFLFPLTLVFPAISLGKKLTLLKITKEGKAYRKNFFLSVMLFILVAGSLYTILSILLGVLSGFLSHAVTSDSIRVWQLSSVFMSVTIGVSVYFFMGPLLTLYALYYKKYLMK